MFISQLFWENACLLPLQDKAIHETPGYIYFFHWEDFVGLQLYRLDHVAVYPQTPKYPGYLGLFLTHSKLALGSGDSPDRQPPGGDSAFRQLPSYCALSSKIAKAVEESTRTVYQVVVHCPKQGTWLWLMQGDESVQSSHVPGKSGESEMWGRSTVCLPEQSQIFLSTSVGGSSIVNKKAQ